MTRLTILIVDDEAIIRKGIERILEDEPVTLLFANNGNEGLTMAQLNKPDLILADLHMPEMTGIEMIAMMKTHGIHIKTIIMTAFDREFDDDIAAWRNSDGSDLPIMRKPIDADAILALVRENLPS